MMARKARIALITAIIIMIIFIVLGGLAFLYFTTDLLKPSQTLFAKYFSQNINAIEVLENINYSEIENKLNENKYTSQIEGKIEYTENLGTSDENNRNPINNVSLEIERNVDKANNYNYNNVTLKTEDEDLFKFEYLNDEELSGIRLYGIKQFVSVNNNESNDATSELGMNYIKQISQDTDIFSKLTINEEEKNTLKETYMNLLGESISKDKYHKQGKTLITVNNKDIQTNAYCLKITVEEYNDLKIKVLEKLKQDEVILKKLDLIENEMKTANFENEEKTLRDNFTELLEEKIEEIKDNNIGNDEVKITVYENNGKTVRTLIEKNLNKLTIDIDDSYLKIDNTELGEKTNEEFLTIQNVKNEKESNVNVEYKNIKNNEIIENIKALINQENSQNNANRKITIDIINEENKATITLNEKIKYVDEFDEQITLDTDNINLSKLSEEKLEYVKGVLMENISEQIERLSSVINVEDILGIVGSFTGNNNTETELPEYGEVSEVEKKRFNSQFEFFEGEDLSSENIKELIESSENNLENIKVLLKDGTIEELDIKKLDKDYNGNEKYEDNIEEIIIYIKENKTNEDKKEEAMEYIDKLSSNNKYSVGIQYDENELVKLVRIKLQED